VRADRDPLIAEIKRHNPTKLRVFLVDGETRDVPVSSQKRRWEKLLGTLECLQWESIECLDREGGLVGIVEGEAEPTTTTEGDATKEQKLLALLKDAMQFSAKETARQYDAQMAAFVELTGSVMSGLKVVQESYGHAMRVQAATQAVQNVGEANDIGIGDLLKFAMMQRAGAPLVGPPQPAQRLPPKKAPPRPSPAQNVDGKSAEPAKNGVAHAGAS
jgi:hypothetical protein